MFDLKIGDEVQPTKEAINNFGKSINNTFTAIIKRIEFRPPSKPYVVLSRPLFKSEKKGCDSHWVEKVEKTLDMSQIN